MCLRVHALCYHCSVDNCSVKVNFHTVYCKHALCVFCPTMLINVCEWCVCVCVRRCIHVLFSPQNSSVLSLSFTSYNVHGAFCLTLSVNVYVCASCYVRAVVLYCFCAVLCRAVQVLCYKLKPSQFPPTPFNAFPVHTAKVSKSCFCSVSIKRQPSNLSDLLLRVATKPVLFNNCCKLVNFLVTCDLSSTHDVEADLLYYLWISSTKSRIIWFHILFYTFLGANLFDTFISFKFITAVIVSPHILWLL